MYFFHPIQQSAQQIYHSALALSPTSSQLHKLYLQSVVDNQISHVAAYSGAPGTWGSLLRTIDVRPRQLTCTTAAAQWIIAVCEDIVNIYDAVTFALQQSLCAPEAVMKIQGSPDMSTLFFVHWLSVTAWDLQTGGLVHTFQTQSEINDIAVSTTGDHVACGLSDGSVVFWDVHTKEEGEGFREGQPVVTLYWMSALELVVSTQSSVYICDIFAHKISASFSIPGHVWGMVYSPLEKGEFLVGTSQQVKGVSQVLCSFEIIKHVEGLSWIYLQKEALFEWQQPEVYHGTLLYPTLVGEEIACITLPSGVQSFNTKSCSPTNNPPLLKAATSMAVSLNRNLVVGTKDSIQIFSFDVLASGEVHNDICVSKVYPLGGKHIICVFQETESLTLLESETLQELRTRDSALLRSSLADRSPSVRGLFIRGLVAEFGIPAVMQAWESGTPLPEWTEAPGESAPLGELSPECTRVVTVYGSPWRGVRVKDAKDGTILANLLPADDDLRAGEVYDLTFDSETRFYLKIDRPGWHVQIPHDIMASGPGDYYSHTIIRGAPVHLSEPRETPPYTLDENCEWVLDAESRKICWISPGNVRRGNSCHFWAGLSLIMVGDDGVVRKLTFKEPGC